MPSESSVGSHSGYMPNSASMVSGYGHQKCKNCKKSMYTGFGVALVVVLLVYLLWPQIRGMCGRVNERFTYLPGTVRDHNAGSANPRDASLAAQQIPLLDHPGSMLGEKFNAGGYYDRARFVGGTASQPTSSWPTFTGEDLTELDIYPGMLSPKAAESAADGFRPVRLDPLAGRHM